MKKSLPFEAMIEEVYSKINKNGLISIDKIYGGSGSLAMPRKQEVMATYNRYRKLIL
ncbi:hypothetical protein ACH36K_02130 [Clostridium sp. MB05]|uniref:hypothetical protein n=1 Tax=Clostridium sp. MB05 TaxID=3376682 RepID=UPI003981CF08